MAFNYGADPKNSDRDKVRLMIGDTDSDNSLLQDSEINFFIDNSTSIFEAAARACYAIAGKFGEQVNTRIRDLRKNLSDRFSNYTELGDHYMDRSSEQGSWDDLLLSDSETGKDKFEDSESIEPIFKRNQHEVKD